LPARKPVMRLSELLQDLQQNAPARVGNFCSLNWEKNNDTRSHSKGPAIAGARFVDDRIPGRLPALPSAFYDQIQPCDAIEHHFVDWIVMLAWEVQRLIRIKAELINGALLEALKNLLKQVLSSQGLGYSEREKAIADLGAHWFVDEAAKAEVAALLAKLGLDEATIEAEAHRLRAAEIE
jgi:hypothetical protein